jgi:hypothetical protein
MLKLERGVLLPPTLSGYAHKEAAQDSCAASFVELLAECLVALALGAVYDDVATLVAVAAHETGETQKPE